MRLTSRSASGRVAVPLALAVLLTACEGEPAPGWLALSGGTRAGGAPAENGARLRLAPDGASAWVDHEIAPGAWRAGERDTWNAVRPDGVGFMKSGESLTLAGAGTAYVNRPEVDNPVDLEQLEPGSFAAVGELLHLCLAPDQRPTETLVFSVEKRRAEGARPVLGAWTGEGFSLWPGESMRFTLDVAPERTLQFYWCAEGLLGPRAMNAWLRVTLDGAELLRVEGQADARGMGRWCWIELPARRAATLAFELGGEPCLSAVLAPRVGPSRSAPTPDEAPRQPDLILFLADTFRADNLAHAGGAPELAPALNALAARSLTFTTARAPSTWTLPAQASMLTGLYPEQHGATSLGHALAPELETLAELLARHGYRTGAVTDSAFVSRHYGLDQGFEWFQEFRSWSLGATLAAAREFLAADDGRPAFLFVQTYRTHMPYRTGANEERQALETLVRALRAGSAKHGGDGSITEAEAGARMLALYHEGVRALDAQFGTWWDGLAELRRGPTFLAFTSDHGEAFFEHGELGHGGSPWEEKIRIPLFLHGPDLGAAMVEHPASLVDLPRTFLGLAGVEPPVYLEGRDLVALAAAGPEGARPAYSFVRIAEAPMVAVLEGTRKIYGPAEPERLAAGEVLLATDLAADPGERDVLAKPAWSLALARAQAEAIAHLVRAVAEPERVELSAEDRAFLDGIGYGGE